jgi:hypothetical protein
MSYCKYSHNELNIKIQKNIVEKLKNLALIIPCEHCAKDYIEYINLNLFETLDLTQNNVIFYWTVDFHNAINKKLNKQTLSYIEAENIWS